MGYLVLARKYRPQTFEDVVGQAHVTRTLANAIRAGRLAHAILFCGPRGTGKTTTARILAKAANCAAGPTDIPCNACGSCCDITAGTAADVHEIDGASNNGVDHIRDLRDHVRYMPVAGRYKIYIIDEVHMLSTAAFNALLKTLEEPPAHVLFFLATTEPRKLPVTILSRCQRHDLRRVSTRDLVHHFQRLCAAEGVCLPAAGIHAIAREAAGSVRDGLSLLDQVIGAMAGNAGPGSSPPEITHQEILDLLGVAGREAVAALATAVLTSDAPAALSLIDRFYTGGMDLKTIYSDLVTHLRNLLVLASTGGPGQLVDASPEEQEEMMRQAGTVSISDLMQLLDILLKEEQTLGTASRPRIAMELILLRLFQIRPTLPMEDLIRGMENLAAGLPVPPRRPESRRVHPETPAALPLASPDPGMEIREPKAAAPAPPPSPPVSPMPAPKPAASSAAGAGGTPDVIWRAVAQEISREIPPLAPFLTATRFVGREGNALHLECGNGVFGAKRLEKHRAAIEAAAARRFGEAVVIRPAPGPEAAHGGPSPGQRKAALRQEAVNHPVVQAAMEIFQGRILRVDPLDPGPASPGGTIKTQS
ncbi:MAG: DNA polymerase III subunit gamma/tau [Desulfobacterales bacterium]|nr:MAG: DNA polymerase III subunit gamma/tau [Desulfobacterales bacterium]